MPARAKKSLYNEERTIPMTYLAPCPSCQQEAFFKYIGMQHWPEATASAMGFDTSVALYECTNCTTCVTEYSLNPAIAPAGLQTSKKK
ncbi:hypothetical protein KC957_04445 [Candidatus Saccharibacteria bacterium]|nr:hypothetical protein [Candidatus Saccharibacteria bacterium]